MKTADVINYFGGVKETADALDLWPQAVYQWGEDVPKMTAYKVQVLSEGVLKVKSDLDELI